MTGGAPSPPPSAKGSVRGPCLPVPPGTGSLEHRRRSRWRGRCCRPGRDTPRPRSRLVRSRASPRHPAERSRPRCASRSGARRATRSTTSLVGRSVPRAKPERAARRTSSDRGKTATHATGRASKHASKPGVSSPVTIRRVRSLGPPVKVAQAPRRRRSLMRSDPRQPNGVSRRRSCWRGMARRDAACESPVHRPWRRITPSIGASKRRRVGHSRCWRAPSNSMPFLAQVLQGLV